MLAAMRGERSGGEGVTSFRAVTLALAGTLGVGNIVGVASAIRIGGAGAIFWMWVSACVAMILKYAEVVLAVRHRRPYRRGWRGGAYYYIKDHFEAKGKWRAGAVIAAIFAVLILLNALSMGCIVQVNAVAEAMTGVMRVPSWVSACLLALLLLPFLTKGAGGIAALTERLVPIMSGGYLLLSLGVLILRHEALGGAVASIFSQAFTTDGVTGGAFGVLLSEAARVGTMRGLLSNEAGCGTAPTAHAAASAVHPAAQGVWGIFEVFVDTILLCTATALVMLVSPATEGEGVMAAIGAYSAVLGDWAGVFLAVAVFCFAYATLLCWMNYANESIAFLSRRTRWRAIYAVSLIACIFVGSFSALDGVLALTDAVITALTVLNLAALLCMRREVKRETQNWLVNKG